jgi:micrococcal nuclease
MDRHSFIFWGCIALLFSVSLFYGVNVQKQRSEFHSTEGKIETGSIVKLVRVIDGDTIQVAQEGQQPATVRILGIKAFNAKIEKDLASPYGHAAVDTLERITKDRSIRVLLNSPPKDRYGRYLAMLYVDDQDVGLRLVRDGLVLVYTVFPFPGMAFYLQEQELARAGRRGLWASTEMTSYASSLMREWQGRQE